MLSGKKCFVIITGASRGLGRSVAAAFVEEVDESSKFLVLARSTNDLVSNDKKTFSFPSMTLAQISSSVCSWQVFRVICSNTLLLGLTKCSFLPWLLGQRDNK